MLTSSLDNTVVVWNYNEMSYNTTLIHDDFCQGVWGTTIETI
jgi:hypothetical protein